MNGTGAPFDLGLKLTMFLGLKTRRSLNAYSDMLATEKIIIM